ncbi:hypothetical protein [Ferrimonas balearica]|nr:hypothetical protein [Ferrimonas balearica]MBY5991086.1 hypothetical protein [Ferrimonas balearica]
MNRIPDHWLFEPTLQKRQGRKRFDKEESPARRVRRQRGERRESDWQ